MVDLEDAIEVSSDYRDVTRKLQKEMNYRALGQHMRSVRKKHHMTQAEVAEEMQMTEKYYASIETGTIHISLLRLIQFISLMQVSADSLLIGCREDYPSNPDQVEHQCADRIKLERILDRCSDEQIRTLRIIAEGLTHEP